MSLYCSIFDCYNLPERNGICATHNHEQRRAEREAKKPVKKYSIHKRSDKKKKEDVEYSKIRKQHLVEHPNCQIKIMGICEGRAIEVHHPGKRGKNYLKKELFMSSCRPCHAHVETVMSAKERRSKGLLKD